MSTVRDVVAVSWSRHARSKATTASTPISASHRSSFRGFALIVGALIVVLSGALMTLNIMLVHGAFAVQTMQTHSQSLERQQQALGDAVASGESPAQLAQRASALGMRPAVNPIFLKVTADASSIAAGDTRHKERARTDVAAMPH